MKKSIRARADGFQTEHRKKKSWLKVVTVLGAIVVFCTTYALILPAITMEKSTFCELEEHQHTEECYGDVTVPAQRGALLCTEQEHRHDESCWENRLICTLEEGEEHTHGEDCYEKVLLCELPEHLHDDACYEIIPEHTEQGLVCGKEEHTHVDACYDAPLGEADLYACGLVQHTHTEECYFEDGTLKCTLGEHTHDASCMVGGGTETEADWTAAFADVQLGENYAENLRQIALTQVGYEAHPVSTPEGVREGYTRYGAWLGDPYMDWNVPFVLFCGTYAQVPGFNAGVPAHLLTTILEGSGGCHTYGEDDYAPKPGDLVIADGRLGVLIEYTPGESCAVIEGDCGGTVQTVVYRPDGCQSLVFYSVPERSTSELAFEYSSRRAAAEQAVSSVGAVEPDGAAEQTGGNYMTKTVSPLKDGGYDLTLEGWSQTSTSPLDIVLLFDISGSMRYSIEIGEKPKKVGYYSEEKQDMDNLDKSKAYYIYGERLDFYWGTIYYNAQENGWYWSGSGIISAGPISKVLWVTTGVNIYDKRIDVDPVTVSRISVNREAAIEFCKEIHDDAVAKGVDHKISLATFNDEAKTIIVNRKTRLSALTELSELENAIKGIDAVNNTGTNTTKGLKEAQGIMNNAPKGSVKVLLFFTDGDADSTSICNSSITTANQIKAANGNIFSVGIYDDESVTANIRRFLYGVSSENKGQYTSMSSMSGINPQPNTGGYFLLSTSKESLMAMSKQIAGMTRKLAESMDEKAIMHDALGNGFILPDPLAPVVKLYKATGTGDKPIWVEVTEPTEAEQAILNGITVSKDANRPTKKFTVTGYNYNKNSILQENGSWQGYKMSVTVNIIPDPATKWNTASGASTYQTNEDGGGHLDDNTGETVYTVPDSPTVQAYLVEFSAGAGEFKPGEEPKSYYVLPGTQVPLASIAPTNNPVLKNSTFKEWKLPDGVPYEDGVFTMPGEKMTITADYEVSAYSVKVIKKVAGSTAAQTFSFEAKLSGDAKFTEGTGYTLSEDKQTATFELLDHKANPESEVSLIVPVNANLTVKELTHDGYYVTFDAGDHRTGDTYTFTVTADTTLTVTNTVGSTLPTTGGVGKETLYLIGAVLILGAVVYGCTPKRKRERGSD